MEELLAAIRAGDEDQVAALATQAPARDESGISFVLQALYHRQESCARTLAAARDELDLFEAAALGDATRVTTLLDGGADVNARAPDGFTALHLAAFFARPDAARALLEHGADANAVNASANDLRPLHSAAAVADHATIALLLDAGAEPDATQAGGWTALHAVAKRKAQPCIDALLAAGADLHRANDDGTTPADLLQD